MRPIDGDKLLEAIEKERQYLRSRGLYGAEHILVHNFRNLVEDAPTVEYTFEEAFQKTVCEQRLYCPERPQGEWGKWVISEIRCPKCLEYFDPDYYSKEELNKCPSCGAKMDGDAE